MAFETPDLDIPIEFAALGAERLEGMVAAGRNAVECHGALAQTGDNIAEEMGWNLTRRPETFSPEDFIRLARFVSSQE
mgnify:CR=1 FL=1